MLLWWPFCITELPPFCIPKSQECAHESRLRFCMSSAFQVFEFGDLRERLELLLFLSPKNIESHISSLLVVRAPVYFLRLLVRVRQNVYEQHAG